MKKNKSDVFLGSLRARDRVDIGEEVGRALRDAVLLVSARPDGMQTAFDCSFPFRRSGSLRLDEIVGFHSLDLFCRCEVG